MAELKTNVNAVWNGGTTGNGTLKAAYLDTKIAIPTDLKGSGNETDPKELLVSSATTCYIATLTSILENRKLPIIKHIVNSEATISDNVFTISHNPQIVLSAEATEAQIQSAERAIVGADRACEVGNLLKKQVWLLKRKGMCH